MLLEKEVERLSLHVYENSHQQNACRWCKVPKNMCNSVKIRFVGTHNNLIIVDVKVGLVVLSQSLSIVMQFTSNTQVKMAVLTSLSLGNYNQ